MASGQNSGLDSVYFYLRCWLCPVPFKGCEANLKQLLEKSRAKLTSSKFKVPEDAESSFLSESLERERCVVHHLIMLQEFLFQPSSEKLSEVSKQLENGRSNIQGQKGSIIFVKQLIVLSQIVADGQN